MIEKYLQKRNEVYDLMRGQKFHAIGRLVIAVLYDLLVIGTLFIRKSLWVSIILILLAVVVTILTTLLINKYFRILKHLRYTKINNIDIQDMDVIDEQFKSLKKHKYPLGVYENDNDYMLEWMPYKRYGHATTMLISKAQFNMYKNHDKLEEIIAIIKEGAEKAYRKNSMYVLNQHFYVDDTTVNQDAKSIDKP